MLAYQDAYRYIYKEMPRLCTYVFVQFFLWLSQKQCFIRSLYVIQFSIWKKEISRIISSTCKRFTTVWHTNSWLLFHFVCAGHAVQSVGRWKGGAKPTPLIMIACEVALIICSAATTLRVVCTSQRLTAWCVQTRYL